MIRKIASKDKSNFISYCQKIDEYKDFYYIKNDIRLFLNDTKNAGICFNDALKKGNKIFISEQNNEIDGVILIIGYSNKSEQKHLKILANSNKIVKNLLRYLFWNVDIDLYISLKENNSLKRILEKSYFEKLNTINGEDLYLHKKFIQRIKKYGYSNNK